LLYGRPAILGITGEKGKGIFVFNVVEGKSLLLVID
jgi:hypothetical protein